MFRLFILAALSFCFVSGWAQNNNGFKKPDYNKIEKITKDKKLATYYPKLFSRYQHNDTTLSLDDFRLLYYGYFFQPGYSSFGIKPAIEDSVKAIYNKDVITVQDKQNLLLYTKEALKSDPYNIRSLYRLYRLYRDFGDTANMSTSEFKLTMIAKTVFSTGDGKTDTTGIHVLSVDDEYAIISMIGLESDGNQQLTPNACDHLGIKPNDEGVTGMYFDVKEIFAGYNKGLKPGSNKTKKGRQASNGF